jgi:hypothetical protein
MVFSLLPISHLAVIHAKGHAQHILGVPHEPAGGAAAVDVPQTQGAVPGTGQAKLAIRGDDDILNKVAVATQRLSGKTVAIAVARQAPDNDGLVAASGKGSRSRACDPIIERIQEASWGAIGLSGGAMTASRMMQTSWMSQVTAFQHLGLTVRMRAAAPRKGRGVERCLSPSPCGPPARREE